MASKEKRRVKEDDTLKPLKKKGKHEKAQKEVPPSPAVCQALYIYLQSCGLRKTAGRLSKELSQDFAAATEGPGFALRPLFEKVDAELLAEKSVKTAGTKVNANEECKSDEIELSTEDIEKLSRRERKEKAKAEIKAPGPLARLDLDHWNEKATADNSWQAKGGDLFAEKAAKELGRVRGKDFRTEKAKKKRATWNGQGAIDMRTNSIKYFDSD